MPQIITKPKGTKGVLSLYGGCEEFINAQEHQVFLYGGRGAGKTVACCLKLFLLCLKYPGVRALITRDSYVALVKSALNSFEMVAKTCGYHIGKKNAGQNVIYRLGESKPTEYRFPYAKYTDPVSGKTYEGESRILIASLSNAKDELGTEYDYVYVNQPELITEADWLFLVSSANGRRMYAPRPYLFGDPNPENERHWIKLGGYEYIDGEKDREDGKWRLIKSTFKDNPTIWDHKLDCYTKDGEGIMNNLKSTLNPVMTRRWINAEWCSYEGLVFGEILDRQKHVRPRSEFNITDDWERYWAIDFGFSDPCAVLFFAKNPDKEQYVCYKYIYETNKTIYDHAQTIKNHTLGEPRPKLIVADRNPENISILSQELGMNIISAKKGPGSIKAGINVLTDMLKNNELVFLEDSWAQEDQSLLEKKHPIGFIEEAENYRWDLKKIEEAPIGGQDHAIDACRYLMTHIKANQKVVPFIWI